MQTKIYIADVSSLNKEEKFKKYFNTLPKYRQEKIERLMNKKDKCLSLGVGVLLSFACRDFGICGEDFFINYNENGKPFLKNEQVFFSLSHSVTKVMCIISEHQVGCDVEKIREYKPLVAKKIFSEKENIWLNKMENKDLSFYRLWTLKESLFKMKGTGLNCDYKNTSLDLEGKYPIVSNESIDFFEMERQGFYYSSAIFNGEKGDYNITEIEL